MSSGVPARPGLVIFDCDGVLVDSEPIANRVFAEHLTAAGFPMTTEEAIRALKGRSMRQCVELLERRFGRALPERFVETLQAATGVAFARELRPVPGIAEALDRIACPVCVASSGEHVKMGFTLGLTGLLPRFDGRLFSATEVARGKPAPDLFLHAAARLGVAPEACVVIEDSALGVEGAVAARMRALGFAGASCTDPAALAAAGATLFGSMEELPALLGF
jgi:HAD superfamily hydrolase (TIGR01509 family)